MIAVVQRVCAASVAVDRDVTARTTLTVQA